MTVSISTKFNELKFLSRYLNALRNILKSREQARAHLGVRASEGRHLEPWFSASSGHRQRNPTGRMLIGCAASATLFEEGRYRLTEGQSPRMIPSTRVSDIARRSKGGRILWYIFFVGFNGDYVHARHSNGPWTTVTWRRVREIVWATQNLSLVIVAIEGRRGCKRKFWMII